MSRPHNKSVTLLELLVAISLLSLIAIGFSSIEIFSKYQVASTDRRAKLQNEAAFALEHITKRITQAIGNANDWAVKTYSDGLGIRIRIDDNPANGRIDATDRWIAYRHLNIGALDSEIRFYPNAGGTETPNAAGSESIVHQIKRTNLAEPPDTYGLLFDGNFVGNELQDNVLEVRIIARWQPDQDASVDNPEVTMRTRIKMPSVSTNYR